MNPTVPYGGIGGVGNGLPWGLYPRPNHSDAAGFVVLVANVPSAQQDTGIVVGRGVLWLWEGAFPPLGLATIKMEMYPDDGGQSPNGEPLIALAGAPLQASMWVDRARRFFVLTSSVGVGVAWRFERQL